MTFSAQPLKRHRGFSLMEVVIALAVFATGLVVLVGLLPQNLEGMRKSSAKSMQRRIAQNIIGELMLNDWDRLHLFGSKTGELRYFDSQGIPLEEYSDQTVFTARIKVLPRDVNLDQNLSLESAEISESQNYKLPDDEGIEKTTSQHARRVIIEVTDVPLKEFDFDDPANRKRILRVGTVVANLNDVRFE